MSRKVASVILVVGVGRSGTSLTMQALRRLGACVSDRLVPPSDSNRRGPIEDLEVRENMLRLSNHLGNFTGPRPPGWRATPVARETEAWLEGYLAHASAEAEAAHAVKFPLASVFLPLWLDAAERSKVELRLVWATRRAGAVVASQLRSYRPDPERARRHVVQRTLYLLEDAPGDTLLLPYEGWRAEPREQIAALAEAAGLPPPNPDEVLHDLYDPEEDRSSSAVSAQAPLPPGLREADRVLAGRLGPLRAVLDDAGHAALAAMLRETLMQSDAKHPGPPEGNTALGAPEEQPAAEEPQPARSRLRQTVARLRDERDTAQGKAARVAAERDGLRQQLKALEAEAVRLRRAYDALVRERDLADVRLADMEARHAAALAEMEGRWHKARAARKAARGGLADVEGMVAATPREGRSQPGAPVRSKGGGGELKAVKLRLSEERARAKAEAEVLRGQLAEAKAALTERAASVERTGGAARRKTAGPAVRGKPRRRRVALPAAVSRLWAWRARPD